MSETPNSPVIEREELISKLEKIPTEVLRNILTNQVDLEIRLKHKELSLTEEEIGKCEAQMLALRKFLEVPNEISFRNEPSDFTLKYYSVLNESLSVNFTRLQQQQYLQQQPVLKENMFDQNAHSYRTRSTTSSLRPSLGAPSAITGCLYRRTDGVIVKLTCSYCHRSNFSSAQGFLNHNRIAHSKEFTSQDAAALSCGEALAEEFQDEEGLASIAVLRQKELDPSRNLNGNIIVYEKEKERRLSSFPFERRNSDKARKREDEVGSQELMKKLIENGIALDAETYKKMVQDIREEVPNSHLFAGEKEVEIEELKEIKEKEKKAGKSGKSTGVSIPAPVPVTLSGRIEEKTDEKVEKEEPRRADTGGKYEHRLRRRKSRSDFRDDDDDYAKRRRR